MASQVYILAFEDMIGEGEGGYKDSNCRKGRACTVSMYESENRVNRD